MLVRRVLADIFILARGKIIWFGLGHEVRLENYPYGLKCCMSLYHGTGNEKGGEIHNIEQMVS